MDTQRLPERLDGPRIVLHRWVYEDLDRLMASVARNLDHLRPWMPWIADEPLTRKQREDLMGRWQRDWETGGDAVYGVLLRDGEVVGGSGLHRRRGPHGLEIGYWVDQDHQGQGVATEAASMLTDAAFEIPEIDFVEIHHDKANVASGRVPEKLGYERIGEAPDEATSPGEVGIEVTWRITKASWGTQPKSDTGTP